MDYLLILICLVTKSHNRNNWSNVVLAYTYLQKVDSYTQTIKNIQSNLPGLIGQDMVNFLSINKIEIWNVWK